MQSDIPVNTNAIPVLRAMLMCPSHWYKPIQSNAYPNVVDRPMQNTVRPRPKASDFILPFLTLNYPEPFIHCKQSFVDPVQARNVSRLLD